VFGFGDVQQLVDGAAVFVCDGLKVSAAAPVADRGDGDASVGGSLGGSNAGERVNRVGHCTLRDMVIHAEQYTRELGMFKIPGGFAGFVVVFVEGHVPVAACAVNVVVAFRP
jgi:hypothetical protein